jgi:predicted alpha/beta-fold hydrolase
LSISLSSCQQTLTANSPLSIPNTSLSANLSTYYNKYERDTKYQSKLAAILPLSINSVANTTSVNLSSYATQANLSDAMANLVSSAPANLSTLREIATATNNDPNFQQR